MFIVHCSPFIVLVLVNIGDVLAIIGNIPKSSYASSATRIVNPKKPNINPLEVDQPIANLIVLSDSYDSGEVSFKMVVNFLVLITSEVHMINLKETKE